VGWCFERNFSLVGVAGPPEDVELALALAIADPIEAHIHGFETFLFDGVIDDSTGCAIVHLHGCCRLDMAQFFQGSGNRSDALSIEEQGT